MYYLVSADAAGFQPVEINASATTR